MTDTIIKIPLDEIETTCRDALLNHGANAEAAAHVANAVRVAEAKSNLICGLYYMESYCQQLRSGRVKGDVQPIVSQPKSACVAVDAGFGFAQPAFAKALPLAVETARQNGGLFAGGLSRPYLHRAGLFYRANRAGGADWDWLYQCLCRCRPAEWQQRRYWHEPDCYVRA